MLQTGATLVEGAIFSNNNIAEGRAAVLVS